MSNNTILFSSDFQGFECRWVLTSLPFPGSKLRLAKWEKAPICSWSRRVFYPLPLLPGANMWRWGGQCVKKHPICLLTRGGKQPTNSETKRKTGNLSQANYISKCFQSKTFAQHCSSQTTAAYSKWSQCTINISTRASKLSSTNCVNTSGTSLVSK